MFSCLEKRACRCRLCSIANHYPVAIFMPMKQFFYVHGVKKKVENAVNTKKIYTFAAAYKA